MPNIVPYQQNVSANVGYAPARAEGQPVSTAIGDSLQGLSQVSNSLVDTMQLDQKRADALKKHQQDQDGKVWAGKAASDAQLNWLNSFQERALNAEPSAPGFTPSLLKDFDKYSNESIAAAPTPEAGRFLEQHLSALRTHLGTQALDFESKAKVQYRTNTQTDTIDTQAKLVAQNPGAYTDALTMIQNTMPAIGAQGVEKLTDYAVKKFTQAAAGTAIQADPQGTLDLLNRALSPDVKSTDGQPVKTGVPWVDAMQAQDQIHYQQQASAAVARNQNMGDRTITQMDAQIATGIPADAPTLLKWKSDLLKAGRPDAFADYVKNEAAIQQTLGKPIEEQAAEQRRMMSDLQTNGGDMKKIAMVKRLSTAIDANIKMATEQPLEFAQLRYGQKIDPLTQDDFSDPGKLGAKIQNRAAFLTVSRLPMKLFTSNEATAVSGILDKMDPKSAGRTYGMFRNAAGDDPTYQAMMLQIANGNKPEAYAGMVWAQNKSVKSGSAWFGPDPTMNADQVATTMVTGARIVNQSQIKGDATDKKQLSMFLPDDKEIQNQFSSMVGDAFAGSPDAARNALNMTRVYYAGRASEKGVIARDKTLGSVDTSIMKEALRMTVGEVADIGGSKVIAPYGMLSGEFENAARDQFIAALTAEGKQDADLWGRVTLRPVGADKYMVLAGQQALPLKNGQPMILDFGAGTGFRDPYGRYLHDQIPK